MGCQVTNRLPLFPLAANFGENAMAGSRNIQGCVICAWRGECHKKFCIPDGGQRCPDFTRDISIKTPEDDQLEKKQEK
jgi:hypothetical protein